MTFSLKFFWVLFLSSGWSEPQCSYQKNCTEKQRTINHMIILNISSLIWVSKKQHRKNVNPSLFIQLAKVQQQDEWKRLGVWEFGHSENVTRQINRYSGASFETILFFDFCTTLKMLICFSLIKRFTNDQKRYSSHLQVSILHRVAPIKV